MRIKLTTKLLWPTTSHSNVFSRIWHENDGDKSPFYIQDGPHEGCTILPKKGMVISIDIGLAHSIRAKVKEVSSDDLGIVVVLDQIIVWIDNIERPDLSDVAIAETLMWPAEALMQ